MMHAWPNERVTSSKELLLCPLRSQSQMIRRKTILMYGNAPGIIDIIS